MELKIVLDPGHGSAGSGASATYDGETIREEVLNLKLAKFLKEELESYEGVEVLLTREDSSDVELLDRTMKGVNNEADVFISLHNNAYGPNAEYDHGSTVLVARGQYKEDLAKKEQELGVNILHELSLLGLTDQGLLFRDSTDGGTYDNGEVSDYYAIIRNGIKNDLMSILIEHAFLDYEEDYRNYLSSDEKLKELAAADARGIARYFGLKKTEDGSFLEPLKNVTEYALYMKDEDITHNELLTLSFFEELEATTEEPEILEVTEATTETEEATEEATEEKQESEEVTKDPFSISGNMILIGVILLLLVILGIVLLFVR